MCVKNEEKSKHIKALCGGSVKKMCCHDHLKLQDTKVSFLQYNEWSTVTRFSTGTGGSWILLLLIVFELFNNWRTNFLMDHLKC